MGVGAQGGRGPLAVHMMWRWSCRPGQGVTSLRKSCLPGVLVFSLTQEDKSHLSAP